jgi:hypothetical protein
MYQVTQTVANLWIISDTGEHTLSSVWELAENDPLKFQKINLFVY